MHGSIIDGLPPGLRSLTVIAQCHLPHVMCHVSSVTSHFMYKIFKSTYIFFLLLLSLPLFLLFFSFVLDKVVKLPSFWRAHLVSVLGQDKGYI